MDKQRRPISNQWLVLGDNPGKRCHQTSQETAFLWVELQSKR